MSAHQPRLVQSHHVHHHIHGDGLIGRFNAWVAVRITNATGTMWAAYLFVAIALVSFPAAFIALLHGDTVTGITWLSQSFLQLVLLAVLATGQRIIGETQDQQAVADHETLSDIHRMLVLLVNQTTQTRTPEDSVLRQ